MAGFKDAFEQGIANAGIAAKNRIEIDSVISQLSAELHEATGGQIDQVAIERAQRRVNMSSIELKVNPFSDGVKTVNYSAIVARSKKEEGKSPRVVEIAEVKLAKYGYPVTLIVSNREVSCHDKGALESALLKMLEEPEVGKLLQHVLAGNA